MTDLDGALTDHEVLAQESDERFDPVYATRVLTDVVPNPWVAREVLGRIVATLRQRGWSDKRLVEASGHFLSQCLSWLSEKRDEMAEAHFKESLRDGRIVFELQASEIDWEAPEEDVITVPEAARVAVGSDGNPMQKSLFEPEYESTMNDLEMKVAVELDGKPVVDWWLRSVVKPSSYYLYGWQKQRIYPDFVVSIGSKTEALERLVFETKGSHLTGNQDTEYKRRVFEALTSASQAAQDARLGDLGLEVRSAKISFSLLSENSWQAEIDAHLSRSGSAQ